MTEKEQADKGSDKGSDKNKNKDKVQKMKVVDWPGATNALQRKLARVVSKVLTGDMQYTNKVMEGWMMNDGGFILYPNCCDYVFYPYLSNSP